MKQKTRQKKFSETLNRWIKKWDKVENGLGKSLNRIQSEQNIVSQRN